ncbi:MAG TPA: DUF3088 domain-containing protein [Pseudobdellovibrionaceae bacterium]
MNFVKDTIFLIEPNFEDPKYPGRRFYCWHCALIEGLLSSFPQFTKNLDVIRIAWPRPRDAIISLVGEQNQTLPLMILTNDCELKLQTDFFDGIYFISDKNKILAALSERHGFPEQHP